MPIIIPTQNSSIYIPFSKQRYFSSGQMADQQMSRQILDQIQEITDRIRSTLNGMTEWSTKEKEALLRLQSDVAASKNNIPELQKKLEAKRRTSGKQLGKFAKKKLFLSKRLTLYRAKPGRTGETFWTLDASNRDGKSNFIGYGGVGEDPLSSSVAGNGMSFDLGGKRILQSLFRCVRELLTSIVQSIN
jgi:hypothetical protein